MGAWSILAIRRVLHQVHEDILERRSRALDFERRPRCDRGDRSVERARIPARHAKRETERDHAVDALCFAQLARELGKRPLVAAGT